MGVFVEATSGDGITSICTLGNRIDVRHIVRVKNKRLYPADIECVGRILSKPQKIEFTSPESNDTKSTWWASKDNLDDGDTYTFDHVGLLPKQLGTEKIHAEITITWPDPNKQESISLCLDVTC
jgi:hypothetical protein